MGGAWGRLPGISNLGKGGKKSGMIPFQLLKLYKKSSVLTLSCISIIMKLKLLKLYFVILTNTFYIETLILWDGHLLSQQNLSGILYVHTFYPVRDCSNFCLEFMYRKQNKTKIVADKENIPCTHSSWVISY